MAIHYTDELADQICNRLIEGESMRRIALDRKMPSRATMLRWMAENKEFEAKCARARLMQADTMDDMVIDVIDDVNAENAHAMKVKLSAIQWRASKLNPKKYGERNTTEIEMPGLTALGERLAAAKKRLEE